MNFNEQPNYYAIIPATIRYNNKLKSAEKLLYGEITALTNKKGYCYAQNKYFANLYQVRNETVSRWISHLQELGYIEIKIIRNDKKEIVSRNIYILDSPYCEKNQYPYCKKKQKRIDKNVKENIINTNIDDDIFYYIINNSDKIPEEFLLIIEKLELNYTQYMLKYMQQEKIDMLENIICVLYNLYNSGFYALLKNLKRENLINLYLATIEKRPDNFFNYYKKAIINSN